MTRRIRSLVRSDGDGPEIDRIFAENRVLKWETHVMADSLIYVIEYMDDGGDSD